MANDPIFGRSLSTSIFAHFSLGAAVSYQIGQRLGINDEADLDPVLHRIVENRGDPK